MPEPELYRSGEKPYHHGSLRAALLTAAERTLREQGVEQVTLRELARQAGVSHGAPSRHFRDRQALLEELAAVGFARLGDAIAAAAEKATEKTGGAEKAGEAKKTTEQAGSTEKAAGAKKAAEHTGNDFAARLQAAATAYIRFALDNPALLELMMTGSGGTDGPEPEQEAAAKVYQRPYLILKELIRQGHESGELRPGDPERLLLIVMATFQGVAGLVSSLKMPLEQAEALVADTTALFVRP